MQLKKYARHIGSGVVQSGPFPVIINGAITPKSNPSYDL